MMHVYRNEPLLFELSNSSHLVHNVATGSTYRVSRDVLRMLLLIDGNGLTVHDMAQVFGVEETTMEHHVQRLTDSGMLSLEPPSNGEVDIVQGYWGTATKHFHTAARDAEILLGTERHGTDYYETELADSPRPSRFKEFPKAPQLPLPRVFERLTTDLGTVLETRRTHRSFRSDPVSLDQLSTILHYTFAPLRFRHTDRWGTLALKASPAGGARHEAEAYVVPLNVSDVPKGLYHYNAERHSLEHLDAEIDSAQIDYLTGGQSQFAQSGFIIFVTALAYRYAVKYRHPRAYRVIMLNAGHLGQTFALVANALGLGPFQTAVFRDSEIEKLLGVDPKTEFSTYILGAGCPVDTSNGLPADFVSARPS